MKKLILFSALALAFIACRKDTKTEEPIPDPTPTVTCPPTSCVNPDTVFVASGSGPYLIFQFKFDSTQARLNSFGMPATVPSTNAACSPKFNKMSAHYIEMAQTDLTAVGAGKVLYRANETDCDGGEKAIAFCQSVVVRENKTFFAIPLSQVGAGTYKWLRVSLAYQNYDIPFLTTSTGSITQWGTVASFLGFNNYVTQYKIKNVMATPSSSVGGAGNHKQGYWGFETMVSSVTYTADGQPPAGATTVVNPNPSSPIPAGSCLVTGEFFNGVSNSPLVITGSETSDIVITVSLSTNKSFEWKEVTFDGYYQPDAGEFPVDMGIRGMVPKY
ncbi:MAG: hypothetical protein IPJ32_01620 [Sphingobacteriaceae bacterium]|nr:hypothetical protein [Sphingobacteriaceae bacterium]